MKIGSGSFDWPGATVTVSDEAHDLTVSLARYEAMRRDFLAEMEAASQQPLAKDDLIRTMREVMDQCVKAAEGKP